MGRGQSQVLDTIRSAGGTITRREAERVGVNKHDLYRLRDEGELIEVSRGVFRLSDAPLVSNLDLVAVAQRIPEGTICLNSALAYWDLTDEIPAVVHVAVRRGSWRPHITYPATKVHVFAAETFDLGRQQTPMESGENLWIYSPERSIVDAIRMRRDTGSDLGLEALRRYIERSGAQRGEILRLARQLRAEEAVSTALLVLG